MTSTVADQQNYFNYFTEIEDEFVRRRGRHMMISPLDWSLIETWKERGVPLDVVLRGINTSFDNYDRTKRRSRSVNSLLYCQQAVEVSYEDYCAARVGANPSSESPSVVTTGEGQSASKAGSAGTDSSLSTGAIVAFLTRRREDLVSLKVTNDDSTIILEGLERSINRLDLILDTIAKTGSVEPEKLESDLTQIEAILLEAFMQGAGSEAVQRLRREGRSQLKKYREGMSEQIYEQTLSNYVAKRLRDTFTLPRLSLFYM